MNTQNHSLVSTLLIEEFNRQEPYANWLAKKIELSDGTPHLIEKAKQLFENEFQCGRLLECALTSRRQGRYEGNRFTELLALHVPSPRTTRRHLASAAKWLLEVAHRELQKDVVVPDTGMDVDQHPSQGMMSDDLAAEADFVKTNESFKSRAQTRDALNIGLERHEADLLLSVGIHKGELSERQVLTISPEANIERIQQNVADFNSPDKKVRNKVQKQFSRLKDYCIENKIFPQIKRLFVAGLMVAGSALQTGEKQSSELSHDSLIQNPDYLVSLQCLKRKTDQIAEIPPRTILIANSLQCNLLLPNNEILFAASGSLQCRTLLLGNTPLLALGGSLQCQSLSTSPRIDFQDKYHHTDFRNLA